MSIHPRNIAEWLQAAKDRAQVVEAGGEAVLLPGVPARLAAQVAQGVRELGLVCAVIAPPYDNETRTLRISK